MSMGWTPRKMRRSRTFLEALSEFERARGKGDSTSPIAADAAAEDGSSPTAAGAAAAMSPSEAILILSWGTLGSCRNRSKRAMAAGVREVVCMRI